MLFNSYIFFIFLLVVLPTFYLLPSKKSKNIFLITASYIFYGYWDWRFCLLLAFSTAIDFLIGRIIGATTDPRNRKLLLIVSVSINCLILAIFKYFNFFVDSFTILVNHFGADLDFLHLHIILPVGLSFYTFQSISYIADVYRKKIEPSRDFIDYMLFVSFFPQLVAGPIERAPHILPQIAIKLIPTKHQLKEGVELIVIGLFKKVIIGDATGRIVDHIFSLPNLYTSAELILGLVLFSIQIYCDFSGYSNIARGTAKLLGVDIMRNFEQPYLSSNITEFWRRWHISLSSWLKDYLYIALGGNRKGNKRTYLNLMITWLLGGLWHGANWTFIIWGGVHGVYVAFHKLLLKDKKPNIRFVYSGWRRFALYVCKVICTYILVLITWLFFRANNFQTIQEFFSKMIHWQASSLTPRLFVITISFFSVMLIFDLFEYITKEHAFISKIKSPSIQYGILSAMLCVVLIAMLSYEPLPFVYFQF
jgi:alginate O-acetyltransferase complex protein AlgI